MFGFDWTNETFSDPVEEDGIYYISVSVRDHNFNRGQDVIFSEGKKLAFNFCLEYFGLIATGDYSEFLNKAVAIKEWFIAPSKADNLKMLVQINKGEFEKQFFSKKLFTPLPIYENKFEIANKDYNKFFAFLVNKVKQYGKEYNDWMKEIGKNDLYGDFSFTASVDADILSKTVSTKFNEKLYIEDIKSFQKALTTLLQKNGYNKYENVIVFYKNQTEIEHIEVDAKVLEIGNNVFLKKSTRNTKLLAVFLDIESDGNNFFLKEEGDFKNFIQKYIFPSVGSTLFQSEPIKDFYKTFKGGYDKFKKLPRSIKVPGVFGIPGTAGIPNSKVNFDIKLKKIRDRESISEYTIDNIVRDIQITYPSMETLEELYDYILNKIPIGELIKILMKCLGIKKFLQVDLNDTNITDAPTAAAVIDSEGRFDFDFDFDFNFSFKFPKLPTIDIYDLYIFLEINLAEIFLNIAKYLIDYIIKYLLDLLRKFCEDRWKPDQGSLPGLKLNLADTAMPNYGNLNDLLQDFIKNLFDLLTAAQICGLLNGEPTRETLNIILNMLEDPKYFRLKEIMSDSSEIIAFFKNLGNIIDKSIYCLYEEKSDPKMPCTTKEYVREMTKQIYRENHDIPDSLLDEIVDFQDNLLNEFKGQITGLPSLLNQSIQDIIEKTNSQEIDLGEKNVYNSMYDSVLEVIGKQFGGDTYGIPSEHNIFDRNFDGTATDYTYSEHYVNLMTKINNIPREFDYNQKAFNKIMNVISAASNPIFDYSIVNFLSGIVLDHRDDLKNKYKSSKKTLSQITAGEEFKETLKQILAEYDSRLSSAKSLILSAPLPMLISFDNMFNLELYEKVTNFPAVIRLQNLAEGENLQDYINIYRKISIYIREANEASGNFVNFSKKISDIREIITKISREL